MLFLRFGINYSDLPAQFRKVMMVVVSHEALASVHNSNRKHVRGRGQMQLSLAPASRSCVDPLAGLCHHLAAKNGAREGHAGRHASAAREE